MHILDKIVAYKKEEVARQKLFVSTKELENRFYFDQEVPSLKAAILSKADGGVIAEFKKKSPSKKNINLFASVSEVTTAYAAADVAGISVLTDNHFFGGAQIDLLEARKAVAIPLLRKEFIVESDQLVEGKALCGASILLIARILTKNEMRDFTKQAHDLGLEVLVEIHNQRELDNCPPAMDIIGVNNRNLDTFEVDYNNSIHLKNQLPGTLCRISESGILDTATMVMLRREGFDGFLVGERFMRSENPGLACKNFLEAYRSELKVSI